MNITIPGRTVEIDQQLSYKVTPATQERLCDVVIMLGDWGIGKFDANGIFTYTSSYLKLTFGKDWFPGFWKDYYLCFKETKRFYKIVGNTSNSLTVENFNPADADKVYNYFIVPLCDEIRIHVIPSYSLQTDPIIRRTEIRYLKEFEESPPLPVLNIYNLSLGIEYTFQIEFHYFKKKVRTVKRFTYTPGSEWVASIKIGQITIQENKIIIPRPIVGYEPPKPGVPRSELPDQFQFDFIKDGRLVYSISVKPVFGSNFEYPIIFPPPLTIKIRAFKHGLHMVNPDDTATPVREWLQILNYT